MKIIIDIKRLPIILIDFLYELNLIKNVIIEDGKISKK